MAIPQKLYFVITGCDIRYEPTREVIEDEVYYNAELKNSVSRGVFYDENGTKRDDAELILTTEMVELGIACTRYGAIFLRPATSGSDKFYVKAKVKGTEYSTEEQVAFGTLAQFALTLEPVE